MKYNILALIVAVFFFTAVPTTSQAAIVTFDYDTQPTIFTANGASFLNPQFTQDGITITHTGNLAINPSSVTKWEPSPTLNGTPVMGLSQTSTGTLPVGAYINFSTGVYSIDISAVRYASAPFTIEAWTSTNGTGTLIDSVEVTADWLDLSSIWGAYNLTSNSQIHSLYLLGSSNWAIWDDLTVDTSPTVPIPGAVWLFGSGLVGLIGVARRKKS